MSNSTQQNQLVNATYGLLESLRTYNSRPQSEIPRSYTYEQELYQTKFLYDQQVAQSNQYYNLYNIVNQENNQLKKINIKLDSDHKFLIEKNNILVNENNKLGVEKEELNKRISSLRTINFQQHNNIKKLEFTLKDSDYKIDRLREQKRENEREYEKIIEKLKLDNDILKGQVTCLKKRVLDIENSTDQVNKKQKIKEEKEEEGEILLDNITPNSSIDLVKNDKISRLITNLKGNIETLIIEKDCCEVLEENVGIDSEKYFYTITTDIKGTQKLVMMLETFRWFTELSSEYNSLVRNAVNKYRKGEVNVIKLQTKFNTNRKQQKLFLTGKGVLYICNEILEKTGEEFLEQIKDVLHIIPHIVYTFKEE